MMIKAKKKLNFLDKTVLFLNYCFAFGILVSYLAPIVDPRSFWPVAFFGLAYPGLLLANVLFTAYWLFRLKKYIFISVTCTLIGWKMLNNNVGFHNTTPDAQKTNQQQIRIMAYNVHSFLSPASEKISTRHDILQVIKDVQPDILNIEEFHMHSKGKMDVCDSLKKIMDTQYIYYQRFSGTADDGSGLAIVSKFPIVNQGIIWINKDDTDTKSIFADVRINNKTIRVYCVHFQSFQLNGEDHGVVDSMAQTGKPSWFGSKRVGGKLKKGYLLRSDQVKMMKDFTSRCPYPFILAGDFNDTPSSYVVNQMADGLKNAFREKGRGLGRTYNGDIPNYQIDYIMAGPQFNILNYTVIEKRVSDHFPIRSDLSIN